MIPGCTICVRNGKHHILHRTSGPIAQAPLFFHPDIAPVPVIRFPDNIDVDAVFFSVFLEEDGGIHSSGKCCIRSMQIKGMVQHACFFHIKFGLFRIIFPLLQFLHEIALQLQWDGHFPFRHIP